MSECEKLFAKKFTISNSNSILYNVILWYTIKANNKLKWLWHFKPAEVIIFQLKLTPKHGNVKHPYDKKSN